MQTIPVGIFDVDSTSNRHRNFDVEKALKNVRILRRKKKHVEILTVDVDISSFFWRRKNVEKALQIRRWNIDVDSTSKHRRNFDSATFFYLERFLKKLLKDQWSSITKGSISHFKHMYIQPFYHSSGLTRNWMFNWCIYYVLYCNQDQSLVCGYALDIAGKKALQN